VQPISLKQDFIVDITLMRQSWILIMRVVCFSCSRLPK